MIYINRHSIPEPNVLKKYLHGKHLWDDVSPEDKKVLREALKTLQHNTCAYCGIKLTTDNKTHIDHFEPRSSSPQKTFCWSNLFLCCTNDGKPYCASYKDSAKNPNKNKKILKPDQINPELYLAYERATVKCREPNPDATLAKNTIERLNLNHRILVEKRENVLKQVDSLIAGLKNDLLSGKTSLDELLELFQDIFGFNLMLAQYLKNVLDIENKNKLL